MVRGQIMGKRKNIIIVLSVIIAVIVLCGIYTFARRAYYIDHPEYADMAVRCTSAFRGLGLDEFPDRYAFSHIELYELNKTSSKSDAKEKSSKKYISLRKYRILNIIWLWIIRNLFLIYTEKKPIKNTPETAISVL